MKKKKMKKRLCSILAILTACFLTVPTVLAEGPDDVQVLGSDKGSGGMSMDTSKTFYLTLAENTAYRWNANGSALKSNEIHLDDISGSNCHYKFFDAGNGFYGIKHIKSGGTSLFVDVDGNNDNENAVLHLWDNSDYSQSNRQFSFHDAGKDNAGRQMYYIQVKKSGLWVGLENNQAPAVNVKLAQVKEANRKAWYVTEETVAEYQGSGGMTMDTEKEHYLTLADDTYYRWNANGSALQGNEIHLDDYDGENCHYKFFDAGNGFYGIKHIKSGGTSRFVDVEDESMDENAVLHLWDEDDYSKNNRQFSFHDAGKDSSGRQKYYIQVKSSGLWVGLENNQKPDENVKLAQVKEENRKAWYVTTETVDDMKGGESRLYDDGEDKNRPIFNMRLYKGNNLLGNKECVNIDTNITPADGQDLTLSFIGTSSKIEAEYDKDAEAYILRAYNLDNHTMGVIDYVWDVDQSDNEEGRGIHIWGKEDDHPSQLWRFVKTDDGENTYKIYNVKSKLWVNYNNNGDLMQSAEAAVWQLDFLNKDQAAEGADWMSELPDNMPVSEINIPGAHDAGASNIFWDDLPEASSLRAQQYYIEEQLLAGVRALDIRTYLISTDDDPIIVHGGELVQCQDQDGNNLRLSDVMETCEKFLDKHPDETIIMCIADNSWIFSTEKWGASTANGIYNYLDKDYIWQGNDIYNADDLPTLGDVRGKIILQRRYTFEHANENVKNTDPAKFGIDLSGWGDNDYSKSPYIYEAGGNSNDLKQPVDGVSKIENTVWVQDYYKASSPAEKMYAFRTALEKVERDRMMNNSDSSTWKYGLVYNYTSTADRIESGRETNALILEDDAAMFYTRASEKRALGIVMMNFIDCNMAKNVYLTNFMQDYSQQITFPESVTLSYGQKLKEADLSGAESKIAGYFQFEREDRIMDKLGTHEVKLSFIPDNQNEHKIISKMIEVQVNPREVTLSWSGTETREYDGKPSQVTAAAGNLLEGDTCEVTVENGNAVEPGTYTATAVSLSNENYQLPENASVRYTISGQAGTASSDHTTNGVKTGDETNILYPVLGLFAASILLIIRKKYKTN